MSTSSGELRPHHAAQTVVVALATAADATGKSIAGAVLDPLAALAGQGPRKRYAKSAARYLAHGVITDAMAASDNPAQVARVVVRYGVAHFPADTRREWTRAAAIELDLAGHRRVAATLDSILATMRVVVEPPLPNLSSNRVSNALVRP